MVSKSNIVANLNLWAERTPDKLAIIDGQRRITYAQFNEMVHALSSALSMLGVKRRDRVISFLPNNYQLLVTFFALSRIGATSIPCTSGYREEEVLERLEKTSPKAAICFTEEQVRAVQKHGSKDCVVISVEEKIDGCYHFQELLEMGKDKRAVDLELDWDHDVGLIVYSSGTTGDPKGVQLSFSSIYGSAIEIARRMRATDEDIFMMPLPLCHLFGIIDGLLLPIFVGGTIITMDRFDPAVCLDIIERERPTILYGVPTMFVREIIEQQDRPRKLDSLRTGMVAGALSSEQLIRDIKDVLGFDVMVGYGMTEMVVISMTDIDDTIDTRATTVGRPYPGIIVKCVDDFGNEVPNGKTGELLVRGFARMIGYYGRPDKDKEIVDEDGWLHTGDLVSIDDYGYIRIQGRKKDVIIRGGRNILPAEIEKIYAGHPQIAEISVVGAPDKVMGEKTVAYVTLKAGEIADEASIRQYAKDRAIGYKAPDRVVILEEMPRLVNGKIARVSLKNMAKQLAEEESVPVSSSKPLDGIIVLDLTRYFPGPFATLRLAERGAEVIKIEDVTGDPARTMDSIDGCEGAIFRSMNRGKPSVALNLKSAEDRRKFYKLADHADVIIESFRPGVTKRLGIDYDTIRRTNPGIVYVSVSGYGQNTSLSGMAGHDLNYMAVSGVLDQLLDRDGNPIKPEIALADLFTGYAASEAVLTGLVGKAQSGTGMHLDVSMTDAVLSIMGLHVTHHSATGEEHGINDNGIGYGVFETKDHRFMTLCALEEKFFKNFCEATGLTHLLPYQHTPADPSNPYFMEIVQTLKARTFAEWCEFANGIDCCMAPVLHTSELADSTYVKERGMIEHQWGLDYVGTGFAENKHFLTSEKPFSTIGEDNGILDRF